MYDDFMLVKKRGGTFDASIGSQGQHGDVFDSIALGIIKALKKGSVEAYDMPVGDAGGMSGGRSPHPSWMKDQHNAEEGRMYG